MNILINVLSNRQVELSNSTLGFVDEMNINDIVLNVLDSSLPEMNWYLRIRNDLFLFTDGKLRIDRRLTAKAGLYVCQIVGSDAQENQDVSTGRHLYKSNYFELEVAK